MVDATPIKTLPARPAYVYMVRCGDDSLYTGWSFDPLARFAQHKAGKGARYTRWKGAVALVYIEQLADKQAAMARERALKKLPPARKHALVAAYQTAGRQP